MSDIRTAILVVSAVAAAAACGEANGPNACRARNAVSLGSGNCLLFQDEGALASRRDLIEQTVRGALRDIGAVLPVRDVGIRIHTDPGLVIPELGLGGRFSGTDDVEIALDPSSPNLDRSMPLELAAVLAHEIHHVLRQRAVGYGSDLLGAMISEGLADHFSIEVIGVDPPPWSTALTDEELARWRAVAEPEWFNTSYNHRAWFIGEGGTIPRWAGYTIGFVMVEEFMARSPGERASTLVDEPARSFVPDS